MRFYLLCFVIFFALGAKAEQALLHDVEWQTSDAALVVSEKGEPLFSWNADAALVPASLAKLATSYLALEKWGLDHRFSTEFYVDGDTLWVRGLGDPFLVSEEMSLLSRGLGAELQRASYSIKKIAVDSSYFGVSVVPGRSKVTDPYNAPLSAVAANFNTVFLEKIGDKVVSAEAQTPLTATAFKLAAKMRLSKERINVVSADRAQHNFAELLGAFLGLSDFEVSINSKLPESAELVYTHTNSRQLEEVLIGAMKYSNNFIANQVFLKLAEDSFQSPTSFSMARSWADAKLKNDFKWQGFVLEEGAGLSRSNRLSAKQIDDLLQALAVNQAIFNEISLAPRHQNIGVKVRAKTGTLNDVRSYAGYIQLPNNFRYRFVFNFNRKVPYRYRDKVLSMLIDDLLLKRLQSKS